MSVNNGQPVSAEVTNAAFMSRTQNTDTVGTLDLLRPTGSGSVITNLQQVVNNIIATLGMQDQDSTVLDFTGTSYITDATAKSALEQLDSALGGIFSSANTWSGNNKFTSTVDLDAESNNQSGNFVTVTSASKVIVRMTNNSLVGISGITAPSTSRIVVLQNTTSNMVVIYNDSSGSIAADRILTGVGDNIELASNASLIFIYDTTSSRWRVIGGSGGSSFVTAKSLTTIQRDLLTPVNGMIIYNTTDLQMQSYSNGSWGELYRVNNATFSGLFDGVNLGVTGKFLKNVYQVQGSSAPCTLSTTPMGTNLVPHGTEVTIVGTSNDNTVTFPSSDISKGIVGYSFTLGKYQSATVVYSSGVDRWVIKSFSN